MLTTVKGTYRQGKVELEETPTEISEETEVLVTFLPTEEPMPSKRPLVLYGAWRGKFPQDFDVDTALNAIRGEWEDDSSHA